jgi:type II secretory pathway component GspD/PulD (secretin)
MREIESMMRIESGDIAVLGGLMEDRLDNRDGRLPGLGDIPFHWRGFQYPLKLLGQVGTRGSPAPDGNP